MSLKIFLDHAQTRLAKHRVGVTVAGSEWASDVYAFENVWVDPITKTVQLCPYCLTAEWSTSTPSGNYARWGLGDFGLTDGVGGWGIKSDKQNGQNRMFNATPMGAEVYSTATLDENQGMWVSFVCFNEGDKDQVAFDCGWSDNTGTGVFIRFWASGKIQVWKDGVFQAEGHINSKGSPNMANKYFNVVLLPMRRREMLIYSPTAGGGFSFVFKDIAEDDFSPTITPASKFWFQSYVAPDVEIAPLKFPTTGWIVSPLIQFADPPEATRTIETLWALAHPLYAAGNDAIIYGDKSYHGAGGTENVNGIQFVEENTTATTFVPNGIKRKCHLRVQLAGNGKSTPYLYGVHRAFKAEYASTPDEEVEVSEFVCSTPTLEVPDSANGVKLSLEFNRLDDLEAIAPKIKTVKNRPCRVELDGKTIIDGYMLNLRESGGSNDRRLNVEVSDIISQADKIQLTSRIPFDGLPLCRPIADGISAIGFLSQYIQPDTTRIVLSDSGFTIPYVPGRTADEFGVIGENGDTILRSFEKLHKLFAEGYIYGEKPDATLLPTIYWLDPIDFSSTPFKTLYCSEEEAIANAVAPEDARNATYGDPETKVLDIEANEVRVTGFDPRKRQGIQVIKKDASSQDATLSPAARPDNWLGIPVLTGLLDERFTNEEGCIRATEFGFDLITQANYVTETPCQLVQNGSGLMAWRGDLLVLDTYAYDQDRITSFGGSFDDETDGDIVSGDPIYSRYFHYTGGTLYNQGGVGLRKIIDNARAKAKDRSTKGSRSQHVVGALVHTTTEI